MKSRVVALLLLNTFLGIAAASAGTIDVIFYDNRFGTINTGTGAYSQISTLPISAAAGIAAQNSSFYVEDLNSNLLTIDPTTGVAQLVGSSALNLTAIVFAGGSNGLFEIDSASNLYSISATSGHATLIGATGLPSNLKQYDTSLSSDGSSLLFTAGSSGSIDELYRISTTTGKATALGSTGITGIAGSAFVSGQLDLFQYGQSTDRIYTAADGSLQFVPGTALGAQIIDGGVPSQLGGTSGLSSPSPEPGTFVLVPAALALGLLALGGIRNRTDRCSPS